LVATSWIFWSFIFATRPEQAMTDPLANLVRLPASLPAKIPGMQPIVKIMEPIAMDVVRIPCWDKAEMGENPTSARWVRLTGKACDKNAEADEVSVRNLSNGFSATVFPTQVKKSLTTDYIPLQAGKNDILIRLQRDGAAVESQISFVRE
jgi:hypothetical protein